MIQKFVLILLLILSLMGCTKEPKRVTYHVDLKQDTGFDLESVDDERLEFRFIFTIAVDEEGSIYVIDRNTRLIKIDKTGKFQWEANTLGQGPGEFMRITDVCIYKDRVLVCDQERMKILTYSKEGKFIDEFKVQTGTPVDIEVDSSGMIYIAFFYHVNNHLLHKYTLGGEYSGAIIPKKYSEKDPLLDSAVNDFCFCIDNHDHLILAYQSEYTVNKYDGMGRLLQEWTRKLPYVPEKPRLFQPNPNEKEIKGDVVIQDVDVDDQDRVYVLWGCKGTEKGMQVDLFSTDGVLMSEFFTLKKPFYDVQKMLTGSNNNFYVVNCIEEPKIFRFTISIDQAPQR